MSENIEKLIVTPEGREGVWLAGKSNVAAWIKSKKWERSKIHNFIGGGPMIIGADWSISAVIACVNKCERLAILTGDAQRQNMGHTLAVITDDRLDMFDIGKITDNDLEVSA